MMDQEKWKKLEMAFDLNEPWWGGNIYADESEFMNLGNESIDLNLMDWLDCNSKGPSYEMINEFEKNGYKVYPIERDSFGYLIGGVKKINDPRGVVITFG